MTEISRVLPPDAVADLDAYVAAGGGRAARATRDADPEALLALIDESGLRGRGGAGFPTATKWTTVRANTRGAADAPTVVVNGAEGEPGSFKDRTLLRRDPFRVIEGALVAAGAVGAAGIVVALKESFAPELARVRAAVQSIIDAGWAEGVDIDVFAGPPSYLYGEETALLEVLDGRPPFPRVSPPFRRGVEELVAGDADVDSGSGLVADVRLAGTDDNVAPPVLVDNVETMANIPGIVAKGAAWFRLVGTAESPGTIVCTITGDVEHPGVAELPMGTPLRVAIDTAAGGLLRGLELGAVLVGVSSGVLTADQLDTELTY